MSASYTITIGGSTENLLSPLVLPIATISAAPDAWSPVLTGTGGDDVFSPGTNAGGTAYMYGGAGNEVFYVSGFNQVVVAQSGGVNTVVTDYVWGGYTLPTNVENLIYNGTASYSNGWITLQGNALNDTIVGNNLGVAFLAGTGNDTLVGGEGDDVYDIAAGDAGDTILGLHAGDDVQLTGFAFTSVAALKAAMTQAGSNVVVNLGGGQTLTLVNQTTAGLTGVEFDLIAPVAPVAEAPTLQVSAASGTAGKAIPLVISASVAYTDPGETLAVLIKGLPTGATLNAGTPGANGTWMLTSAQLTGLTLTVPGSIAATDTLTVSAVAAETDGSTATATGQLRVTVAAPPLVARAPTLRVSPASGVIGVAVPLVISATLVHADSSETLSVLINGVPTGAVLSAGTNGINGAWTLTPAQLTGLTLTAPGSVAVTDTLTVSAVAAETDGSTAVTTGTLAVTLVAPPLIAQAPTLHVAAASGTEGKAMPLAISAALVHADPGETLSVLIAGLPAGAALSAGRHSGNGTWTLTPTELNGLMLTVPGSIAATDTLTVSAVAAETDGSTATTMARMPVTLAAPPAVAQPPNLQVAAASGTEGMAMPLAISAALVHADPGETLSVLITGLPAGATLSAGSESGNGTWTLTAAELTGLTLTVPGSIAATDTLTVSAVAAETDGSTATTTGTLAVTLAVAAPTYSITLGGTQQSLLSPLTLPTPTISAQAEDTESPVLNGTAGNDVFNPGTNSAGTAYMYGGPGNEVFYVSGFNDVVAAQPGGIDTIITDYGWGTYTLPANVQNLIYDGTASYADGWITLQGNTLNDTLVANNNGIALEAGSGNDTLVGGTGNDIFIIDAGNAGDTVIGLHAGDSVELKGFAVASYTALQAAMMQSGSNVVVNLGSGQTLTLVDQTMAGLNAAEFGLPGPSAAGGGSGGGTSGGTPGAVVTDPTVPQAAAPGQVVGFLLRNSATESLAAQDVSFTEVFSAGEVPAGSGLVATVNGQVIPVQMDVLTTNPDGSVAMAMLTMMQPAMAAGQSEGGMLSLAPATTAAPVNITALATDGYQLGVQLKLHNADGSTTPYTLNAVALVQQAISSGKASYILQGPQVTEVQFTAPIAGSLYLTFDMSLYADGHVAADVQFDNDIAMTAVGGPADYDVTITQNGTTALQQSGISQAQYTSWNQPLTTSTAPQAQLVLDINALEATGAVPNYDLTAGISAATIAAEGAALGGPTYGILGSAGVTQYMPETGGRADIGPQPAWDAIWLMTQDPTAIEFALAQANAAGSVPWNFIDPSTGSYLMLTSYPDLWVDYRSSTAYGETPLTQPVPTDTGWTADTAHQPDLSYLAYLLTGNVVYLDELNAQASWAEADDYLPNRQDGLGLVANGLDQVRGQAWSLREIDEAAFANPDGSAMKTYFTQLENNNWSWLVSQIPTWTQQEGQAYGYLPGTYGSNPPTLAPWEQDFFVSTAVQAAEMGNQNAVTFLEWQSNFIVGRFLNAANGFDPHDGLAYNLVVGTASGAPLTTWAQIEQATQAAGDSTDGSFSTNNDYGVYALQSIAGIITVTQSPSAIQAYGWLLASGAPVTGDRPSDPSYDIVPRLSDGTLLTSNNVIISDDTTATTITGSNNDQLIYAGSGNDTVIGGTGINILFAGPGNDVLTGGINNDYLFGGAGADTFYAGAGRNYMQAGSGADVFQLSSQDIAQDIIADFRPGADTLHLLNGAATKTFEAQLIAGATSDAAGDAVLHLSSSHTVVLQGIAPSQLSPAIFS